MQNADYPADANAPADENAADHVHGAGSHDAEALAAALERTQDELVQLKDERLRERAELENQRRRMLRDVENARRFANERLLEALLPVFDSLEAGLAASTSDTEKLREGMQLTLRQLLKAAEDGGLAQVDPAGQPFDADRHQAMSLAASPEHAPGTVVQVFQKGYVLNERLLRPALVVVAKDPNE